MKNALKVLIIAVFFLPATAICQLWFDINLDDGIDFGEVMVDEAEQRVLVANLVEGEGWVRWWFRGDDDCFSVNPDGVFFEPRGVVRQEITLTFRPDQAGEYQVTLLIEFEDEDNGDLFQYEVDLTGIGVRDDNNPPEWEEIPDDITVDEGTLIVFDITGTDPDEDDLTIEYSSDNLPDNVEFTDNEDGTGTFTWQIGYDNAGDYSALFTLSDGDLEVEHEVEITVVNVNRVPYWVEIPEVVRVDENELLAFDVTASDPDDDDLMITFSSEDLPEEVEFTDNRDGTGTFTWQTGFDDAGEYNARFTLSDGDFSIDVNVLIIVIDAGYAPGMNNGSIPTELSLGPVHPNPFNSTTSIRYNLDRDGFITLKLYDLAGREVAELVSERQSTGNYQTFWNAEGMPSGVYLLRLNAGGLERTTKLLLIR